MIIVVLQTSETDSSMRKYTLGMQFNPSAYLMYYYSSPLTCSFEVQSFSYILEIQIIKEYDGGDANYMIIRCMT